MSISLNEIGINSGKKLQRGIYSYKLIDVKDTRKAVGTVGAHHDNIEILFPALSALSQSNFDEQSGDSLITKVENAYDNFGNLVTYK